MLLALLLVAGMGTGVGIGHFFGGGGAAPGSPDAYLQESGAGHYQTEDGSGIYLLE